MLIHPCFAVDQGTKLREIMDCSAGMLNPCHTSAEKMVLPSVDDILDFASRLQRSGITPLLAVADERSAFRNWPNDSPALHIAAVSDCPDPSPGHRGRRTRFFRDNALSFGDGSSVYGYNRVRVLITLFLVYEFFLPCWAYFDDSGMVFPEALAPVGWHAFLRFHQALGVPIKGSPLDPACCGSEQEKLRAPCSSGKFLGEVLGISQSPASSSPTAERVSGCRRLIQEALTKRRITPASASTLAGKLQFLAGSLYSRVGHSGLPPLFKRQSESRDQLTPDIEAGLLWFLEVLDNVGPREWPLHRAGRAPWCIFGDASEPSSLGDFPRAGAILQSPGGAQRFYFSACVPGSLLQAFQPRKKQIAVLELLWAVVAVIVWFHFLSDAPVLIFEDNVGAEKGLLKGMSKHQDINRLLSSFWCVASSAHTLVWADRVSSSDNPADCLTKPGVDSSHLAGAEDISSMVVWSELFSAIKEILTTSHQPRWRQLRALSLFALPGRWQ